IPMLYRTLLAGVAAAIIGISCLSTEADARRGGGGGLRGGGFPGGAGVGAGAGSVGEDFMAAPECAAAACGSAASTAAACTVAAPTVAGPIAAPIAAACTVERIAAAIAATMCAAAWRSGRRLPEPGTTTTTGADIIRIRPATRA